MKILRPRSSIAVLVVAFAAGCETSDDRFAKRAPLPAGNLDLPKLPVPELAPGDPLTLAGWAASEDGIAEVNVYLDRKLFRTWGSLAPRPDIEAARLSPPGLHPSGFHVSLEPGATGPGTHEVTVQVRTNRGAVRELGRLTVVARP